MKATLIIPCIAVLAVVALLSCGNVNTVDRTSPTRATLTVGTSVVEIYGTIEDPHLPDKLTIVRINRKDNNDAAAVGYCAILDTYPNRVMDCWK